MSRNQVLSTHPQAALLVDAGNTRIKWAIWDNSEQGEQKAHLYPPGLSSPEGALHCLTRLMEEYRPQKLVLVHVLGDAFTQAVGEFSEKYRCSLSVVNTVVNTYGIKLAYENPAHFGADRLVALLAARRIAGARPVIMIDCGTAVTIDALEADNQHLGGVILPGLNLLSEALIQRTQAKHMSASAFLTPGVFADNTLQAIGSGCLFSLVGGIEGICQRMQNGMSAQPVKIVCGGDAARIHAHLVGGYQLEASALMRGLSVIAEHS